VVDEVVDDRGRGGDVGDVDFDVCDRLIFFVGGCGCSCDEVSSVLGLVGEALEMEGR